jgi:hypothetical protein
MRKGERLALFIVVILFSITLGLSAMLVKIGYDSFVAAREAKETEEAEKANRWRDDTKVPVDPVYVQPMDPNAGPQGTNPDNADYGGGGNVRNNTEESIDPDFEEPDYEEPEYRKNSESDEGHLVDPEPIPTPDPPKKEYPESGYREPDPPKKEYPESGHKEPDPPKKEHSEPDPNELKQPYEGEYSDPDTGERKTGIVITGSKEDHVDWAEKVEKDPAPVEEGVNPKCSWRNAANGRIDAPE